MRSATVSPLSHSKMLLFFPANKMHFLKHITLTVAHFYVQW